MNDSKGKLGWLVLLLFTLSGFSGLIYEIIWVRLLTMYVGGSAFAVSVVLTVFMAGLAAGSAVAARLVDRLRDPDSLGLAYGVLELAVGLYGLAFPAMMTLLKPVYALLYRPLYHSLLGYNAASGLLSVAVLVVPTLLMGATLPILCRYYVTALSGIGTQTGRLYGLNTIGGAVGALVCGFLHALRSPIMKDGASRFQLLVVGVLLPAKTLADSHGHQTQTEECHRSRFRNRLPV